MKKIFTILLVSSILFFQNTLAKDINEYHLKCLQKVLIKEANDKGFGATNDYLVTRSEILLKTNALDKSTREALYNEILLNHDFFNKMLIESKKLMVNAMVASDMLNNTKPLYNYTYRELYAKLEEILVDQLKDYAIIDLESKIPTITDKQNNQKVQLLNASQIEPFANKKNNQSNNQ